MNFKELLEKQKQNNFESTRSAANAEKENPYGGGGGPDDRFWKPAVDKAGNGSALIRFLPAPDIDIPWVKFYSMGSRATPVGGSSRTVRHPSSESAPSVTKTRAIGHLDWILTKTSPVPESVDCTTSPTSWSSRTQRTQTTTGRSSCTSSAQRSSRRSWRSSSRPSRTRNPSIPSTCSRVPTWRLRSSRSVGTGTTTPPGSVRNLRLCSTGTRTS